MRNCDNCARCGRNGCTCWDCDYIPRKEAIKAYKGELDLAVVKCEDCRECVEKGVGVDCPSGYGYLYCKRMKSVVDDDFYCGWGERR